MEILFVVLCPDLRLPSANRWPLKLYQQAGTHYHILLNDSAGVAEALVRKYVVMVPVLKITSLSCHKT